MNKKQFNVILEISKQGWEIINLIKSIMFDWLASYSGNTGDSKLLSFRLSIKNI